MIFNQPQDGITPHIGDNGNWFLGKNDTGVRANGQTNTELIPLTILASDWNTETGEVVINCAGISANEADQIVTLIPSVESKAACNEAAIECIAIDTNSFTLKADTIPAEDIHIYVAMEVVGKVAGGTDNNVYSLEETVVGTWIDGKPIYRKTILYTVGCSKTTVDSTVLSLPNISLIQTYGKATSKNYNVEYSVPFVDLDGWMAIVRYEYGNIQLRHKWFDDTDTFTLNITIEYTKTTDAATINLPDTAAMAASYEQGVNES